VAKNLFVNRTHQTKVGMSLSEIAKLISGVIQGSGTVTLCQCSSYT